MPKVALKDALGALSEALDGQDELSVEERRALVDLHGEIELVLERTEEIEGDGGRQVHASTLSVLERLESRNPLLAEALGRLANVMASLGI